MSSNTIYTSDKIMPYVYMGINEITGEFYIGSRTSVRQKKPSHLDIYDYRTSSKVVKPRFDEFKWIIIAEFFDQISAVKFEQDLINEYWGNKLLLNKARASSDKTLVYCNYQNKPQKEKETHCKNLSIATKNFWDNSSEEFKEKRSKSSSEAGKKVWSSKSDSERQQWVKNSSKWRNDTNKLKEVSRKISESQLKPCMIDGIVYSSRKEARTALHINNGILKKRLESDLYPNWVIL